jgi:hypothetical protein
LFRDSEAREAETVTGRTYGETFRAAGSTLLRELARTGLAALILIARPRSFASRAHRWRWYRHPYRVSVALLAVR